MLALCVCLQGFSSLLLLCVCMQGSSSLFLCVCLTFFKFTKCLLTAVSVRAYNCRVMLVGFALLDLSQILPVHVVHFLVLERPGPGSWLLVLVHFSSLRQLVRDWFAYLSTCVKLSVIVPRT